MSVPDRDERTYEPTGRRVEEFRKRGEIALSVDLSHIVTAIGAFLGLVLFSDVILSAFRDYMRGLYANIDNISRDLALQQFLVNTSLGVAPVFGGALLLWLLSAVLQHGWPPALIGPSFRPFRGLSPEALMNLFSLKQGATRLFTALAKFVVVAFAAYIAVKKEIELFLSIPEVNPVTLGTQIAASVIRLASYAGFALLAIALFDYFMKRRDIKARMRMTAQEYKREMKEQEGDPHVKGRRRRRMKEISRGKVMNAVKTADVVVVNPTHYAVALRYNAQKEQAPRLVAKGIDNRAQLIRDIARKEGIPILSQPPLARLVYKVVPEGKEIPPNLYHAVAEVLAYIYRLRQRNFSRPQPAAKPQPRKVSKAAPKAKRRLSGAIPLRAQ